MVMQRTFLPLSCRSRCYNLLNVATISSQRKQMAFSILALQHLVHGNYSTNLVTNIFNCIVHQLDLKFSYSVSTNEIKKLSDLIISEDSESADKKRNEELKKILTYLLSRGYTSKDIKEKFLMNLKSKDVSYDKLSYLEDIYSDIALLLPLLSLPKSILKLAAQNSRTDKLNGVFTNRIYYLCDHLDLEPNELIPALAKHSSLLTMNFKRLDDKMNILKNANISSKYIVKDLWIFNYKEQLIVNRIQAALKARVELKPWMLRCSEKIFQSKLIKTSEAQRILGNENVHSYLAKRLECSINYIDYMMERNRLMKTINIPKLDQIINFLYGKGYTPQEVRLFPRVFCSSVQTLEKRFEEFHNVKRTLPTIAQLCMSKKKAHTTLYQEN